MYGKKVCRALSEQRYVKHKVKKAKTTCVTFSFVRYRSASYAKSNGLKLSLQEINKERLPVQTGMEIRNEQVDNYNTGCRLLDV